MNVETSFEKKESWRDPDYEILHNPEVRAELKRKMQEFIEQVQEKEIDSVVFLDKSARPLAWLFQEMWQRKENGSRPDIKFLNVGQSTCIREGVNSLTKSSRYLNSDERRILHERLDDSEQTNDWLTADDIPGPWQEGLSERIKLMEELTETFGHEFDGKNVVILDELTNSGASQLATLGLLYSAFPKIKEVYSTQFFQTDKVIGHARDIERIPWLQQPGLAGVLELPGEELLSAPITTKNIKKVLKAYQQSKKKAWDKEEEKYIEIYRKRWEKKAKNLLAKAQQLRAEMKKLAHEEFDT